MTPTEAAAEPEAEQEEVVKMRDIDEGSATAALPSAAYAGFDHPLAGNSEA